jgi:signal-transduction protein with cAMP-binding, CBS, and nucleotidyltransferase domain
MDGKLLEQVRKFAPFKSMSEENLSKALESAKIIKFPQGTMVFKREQEDPYVYWLLEGSIDLLDEKFAARNRKAGESAALHPTIFLTGIRW